MRYSVWNWNSRSYDVFEAPGEQLGQRPRPKRIVNQPNGRGVQPEVVLPVLPKAAVLIENSRQPQGRIVVHHSSPAAPLGAYDDPNQSPLVSSPWKTLATGAAGVWGAYWMLKYIARRL